MYFSKEILLKAFRGLKKNRLSDEGKSRQERVSALRHFLAVARLLREQEQSSIDLSVNSPLREQFKTYVGKIVSIDGGKLYTKDFGDLFGDETDYAVGSNFLTTRVRNSRSSNVEIPYPGRPGPLLVLNQEHVSIHSNALSELVEAYNINAIRSELSIWLLRFDDIASSVENPEIETLLKIVKTQLLRMYSADLVNIILPTLDGFKKFIEGHEGNILSSTNAGLSELANIFSTGLRSVLDESGDQVLLDDSDPIFRRVRRSIDKNGELNFLFFGAPGTGKTWYASKVAQYLADGDKKRIKFIQFHPSVSYDDFVEGFVPKLSEDSKSVTYEIQAKHFIEFSELAKNDADNYYVMVIDEISRGDPSRIFGELLTYIEPSYRNKEFSLIYSRREFSIPDNLILIATANPYDRSVSEMDDAFLRRFHMVEFQSDVNVLRDKILENGLTEPETQKVIHFFKTIEEKMPYGFGHAQFFNLCSLDDLQNLWESKLSFLLKRSLQFETEKFDEIKDKFEELFNNSENDQLATNPNDTVQNG